MKILGAVLVGVLGVLLVLPQGAQAHCDALDGPVAAAARKALNTGNVNLILPYAPAEAEAEISAAFEQVRAVRAQGPAAQALADRYFIETVVRLHRAGEGAPYTGLKPAGQAFGPAIPAAETALASADVAPVMDVLTHAVTHGVHERFAHTQHTMEASKEPTTPEGVAAARARVRAELGFIGYVEGLYQATQGGAHQE